MTLPTRRLSNALAYWNRLRRDRRMPTRGDVDPVDLRALLQHVYLIDVEGPSRYRYRVIGQDIIDNLKDNATGKLVDSDLFGDGAAEILRMYDHVVLNGVPVINRGRAFWVDNSWRRYVSLILPLSPDGTTVDKIMGVMEFESAKKKPAAWRDDLLAQWSPVDPDLGTVKPAAQ